MSRLEHYIATLASDSIRINLWPCEGGFQANVSEQGGSSWTCVTRDDPLNALNEALRQRVSCVASRTTVRDPLPVVAPSAAAQVMDSRQVDIEDVLSADDLSDLLG